MTPLAHKIMMDQCQPVKNRKFDDQFGLLRLIGDWHCFEISEVLQASFDLATECVSSSQLMDTLKFLPAPRTWIEYRSRASGMRVGVLLTDEVDNDAFSIGLIAMDDKVSGFFGVMDVFAIEHDWVRNPLVHNHSPIVGIDAVTGKTRTQQKFTVGVGVQMLGALAMINTPRIIGRVQHMPHRGLERALIANQKLVGKFPLHAWTEIKLHVTPPKDAEGAHEAHLTGERALHFCRAHLRIRLGRLEVVRAHWRGNPAIGIKQSRYTVTP